MMSFFIWETDLTINNLIELDKFIKYHFTIKQKMKTII